MIARQEEQPHVPRLWQRQIWFGGQRAGFGLEAKERVWLEAKEEGLVWRQKRVWFGVWKEGLVWRLQGSTLFVEKSIKKRFKRWWDNKRKLKSELNIFSHDAVSFFLNLILSRKSQNLQERFTVFLARFDPIYQQSIVTTPQNYRWQNGKVRLFICLILK